MRLGFEYAAIDRSARANGLQQEGAGARAGVARVQPGPREGEGPTKVWNAVGV